MTYPEVIKYLDSFIDYERMPQYPYRQSLRLERIRGFLKILNNPQEDLKCIHIAGTKGKGSTCAFIAYILCESGFKVGLYTSPHLYDRRERIRILSPQHSERQMSQSKEEFKGMISSEELIALVERLKPEIEKYNSQSQYGPLSFFEVYTVLAFVYFKEKRVDFAVLETGMGGRLDATNTVDSLIAAIAPISYEHTKQLGTTLAEIASEKAGIIKNQKPTAKLGIYHSPEPEKVKDQKAIVIIAPQEKEVVEVIRGRAKQQGAILYEIGRDIIFEKEESFLDYQCFNINGAFGRLTDLKIKLLGSHQIINATLAVSVVLALGQFYQVRLNLEAIRDGLYNTIWPGRFEILPEMPLVVLDGAQNFASAQALGQTLTEIFPDKRIILVLGVSQDKDIKGITKALIPRSNEVILTRADNPRAADVNVIEKIVGSQFSAINCPINKTRGVKEAIELAGQKSGPGDLILVTGSLFVVGEARDIKTNIHPKKSPPKRKK